MLPFSFLPLVSRQHLMSHDRRRLSILLLITLLGFATRVATAEDRPVFPLYPGVAPGSEDWTQKEVEYAAAWDQKKMIRNVVRPTLTAYFPGPTKANGTAVIIAPGGAFRFHSWENEGTAVAEWLVERGVTAFVLKYRLLDTGESQEEFVKNKGAAVKRPDGAPPLDIAALATEDGRAAIRLVRGRAAEWRVSPKRIGIMGFSAGGVVASGAAMKYDAESRPDFAAPIYGAAAKVEVPKDAPPIFVLAAGDDKGAAPPCTRLYEAWREAGRQAELHLYAKGGHGFGMSKRGLPIDHWIERFGEWLDGQGLMKLGN
jgi:acetyl esterase/lipase